MASFPVEVVFDLGETATEYTFPLVQSINDPTPGTKSTIIEGNRSSGSIVIPGGQKSIELRIRGILLDNDGYADLTSLMDAMRAAITTNPGTITIRHFNGSTWINDKVYTVRRVNEIEFQEDNLRVESIEYTVTFLVISY